MPSDFQAIISRNEKKAHSEALFSFGKFYRPESGSSSALFSHSCLALRRGNSAFVQRANNYLMKADGTGVSLRSPNCTTRTEPLELWMIYQNELPPVFGL